MTTTLGPIVHRYLVDRRRRTEITDITARGLRNHLLSFADSFGQRPLSQLGTRAVERWQETGADLAPSTRSVRLSSLRGLARWCVLHDVVAVDWTLGLPPVRRPRARARDLSLTEFVRIHAACHSARDRLLVWLMYGAGLRCVEIHRLDVDDVDVAKAVVFVTGKAGHQRYVPIPAPLISALHIYLAAAGHGSGPLVRTEDGRNRRLGSNRISHIAGRLVADAGLKLRPYDGRSAHGLRAAAASDIYDTCHDPQVVQEFLGHAGLGNLHVYLRRAQLERVRQAQDARRWAA